MSDEPETTPDEPVTTPPDPEPEPDQPVAPAGYRPPRPRLPRRRAMRAVAVVAVAALVVVGLGELLRPAGTPDQPSAAVVEPVGSVSLVCPEPGSTPDIGVRVTGVVVPDLPGQDRDGTAVLRTLPGDEEASARIRVAGGQAEIQAYGVARPPVVAEATGGLAPGFTADQWGRAPLGDARGLASVACAPPGAQFWFVGGGATVGRKTRILLVNAEDVAAQVDLEVFGPDGPVDVPAGRGVVVAPRSREVLRVDALVPGTRITAVHVVARSGRVAAAVDDVEVKALQPLGADWIPASVAPAIRVLVPGLSDGPGPRELSVLSTGDGDADVAVRVITGDGTFVPVGVERIDAPAGQVVTVDLAEALKGVAATVELTSDAPIVAGLRQRFGKDGQTPDTAYSAGAPAITGPSAVSNIPSSRGERVRLWITAPESDAGVDLALLPYAGGRAAATEVALEPVTVKAGRLGWVDVEAPEDGSWYTLVARPREGSGPVVLAHRVVEDGANGPLVTGYPWSPLRVTVSVPATREDLGVALPRPDTTG